MIKTHKISHESVKQGLIIKLKPLLIKWIQCKYTDETCLNLKITKFHLQK